MTATLRPKQQPAPEAKENQAAFAPEKSPAPASISGFNGNRRVPPPVNEPVKSYAPGSPERAALKARLKEMSNERIDIPAIIGGKEIRSGDKAQSVMPHNHRHVLADYHKATAADVDKAIEASREMCTWRAPRPSVRAISRSKNGWRFFRRSRAAASAPGSTSTCGISQKRLP